MSDNRGGKPPGTTEEEKPKRKITRKPAIPPGHKRIQFLVSDLEYETLKKGADADDRATVDDFARVLAIRHARERTREHQPTHN